MGKWRFGVRSYGYNGCKDAFVARVLSKVAKDLSLLHDEKRLREAPSFVNTCGAITVIERGAISTLPTS